MQILKSEIRTGLLVVASLGILTVVLLALGAPGVFVPQNKYRIFFDNASGIKQGAPVLLAGRKVGQVTQLYSPIPKEDRPAEAPDAESIVEVQVERRANIYKSVTVRMQQNGLLGEMLIDFAGGQENSGRATDNSYFLGERAADFSESIAQTLEIVRPVAEEAQKTLEQLRTTADNLAKLTAQGSNFDLAVQSFHTFANNLVDLSKDGSPLDRSLENIDQITTDLAKNERVKLTLAEFQKAAEDFQKTAANLNRTVSGLGPNLNETLGNARDFTDTLKRQPWRLIWPSTKKYSEEPPPLPAQSERRRRGERAR
jgi:ABC-type transporter Mla subunit MlaD